MSCMHAHASQMDAEVLIMEMIVLELLTNFYCTYSQAISMNGKLFVKGITGQGIPMALIFI